MVRLASLSLVPLAFAPADCADPAAAPAPETEPETACADVEATRSQLHQLELEQERQTLRLIEVRVAVDESEARALQAQAEEERARCFAQVAELDARVSLREAQCYEARASHQRCLATGERERTDGTLLGCVFGLGVAAATGGAAAPLALGGCAAGRVGGEAAADACKKPRCTTRRSRLERRVLKKAGLTEYPVCEPVEQREGPEPAARRVANKPPGCGTTRRATARR